MLAASAAIAQEFEVATVKQSPPPAGDLIDINLGTIRNGKLTLGNASLSDCLKLAWSITSDAQIAGPDWIKSKAVRFDVVAQAPPDTDRDTELLMLRKLLTDRLGIVFHHEQSTLPFLALTIARDGPKLPASKGTNGNPAAAGHVAGTALSMAGLATLLSRFERQTVVDMTGLKGLFEVNLDWTPEAGTGDAPSLYTALQEQLGLKLESRKGPLDVLYIERAEKVPAAN
jgi:uncharacterized protein (TIGR03435 family)